jgi:MFS transporter, SET family, sugar efflux transporter
VAGAAYYAVVAASAVAWQVAAAQFLAATFVAATMAIGISFFQDLAPGRTGVATSLYSNTSKVSSMLAGPLLGLALHFGYREAFIACAVFCAAGAALLTAIRGDTREVR